MTRTDDNEATDPNKVDAIKLALMLTRLLRDGSRAS